MSFIKTQKVETFEPIKDEADKAKAQKTSAAMKACCGDPKACGGCEQRPA